MMRRVHSTIVPLGCAALLFMLACIRGEGGSPTPGATPTPSPAAGPSCPGHGGRWAMVVLYQKGSDCRHVAGPVRLTACRGENVTWRIYNHCRDAHTVKIDGFVFSEKELLIPPAGEEYESPPPPDADPNGPFEGGKRFTKLKPDQVTDLTLRVSAKARPGFYKYFTILDARPDEDQQIEVP